MYKHIRIIMYKHTLSFNTVGDTLEYRPYETYNPKEEMHGHK